MWLTVNYLGDPDSGVIFAAYVVGFLTAGVSRHALQREHLLPAACPLRGPITIGSASRRKSSTSMSSTTPMTVNQRTVSASALRICRSIASSREQELGSGSAGDYVGHTLLLLDTLEEATACQLDAHRLEIRTADAGSPHIALGRRVGMTPLLCTNCYPPAPAMQRGVTRERLCNERISAPERKEMAPDASAGFTRLFHAHYSSIDTPDIRLHMRPAHESQKFHNEEGNERQHPDRFVRSGSRIKAQSLGHTRTRAHCRTTPRTT
jgi:hypothetical protein